MKFLRFLARVVGWALFVVGGSVGFVLTERLFWSTAGWLGIIVGNILFPLAALIAPFYDGFANGDWTLLIVLVASLFCWPLLVLGSDST